MFVFLSSVTEKAEEQNTPVAKSHPGTNSSHSSTKENIDSRAEAEETQEELGYHLHMLESKKVLKN